MAKRLSYKKFLEVLGSIPPPGRKWNLDDEHALRLKTRSQYGSHCPITAVYQKLTNKVVSPSEAPDAGEEIGLDIELIHKIMDAADNDIEYLNPKSPEARCRREMLRVVGLKEKERPVEKDEWADNGYY